MFTLLMDFGSTAQKAIKAGVEAGKSGHTLAEVERQIETITKTWTPTHAGKAVLTPGLRRKLTAALAELSYNVAAAEQKRPLA